MQVTATNVVVQQVLSEYSGKTVALLSDGTVCKWGPGVSATEAASMRFVAEKTSVPVPKVLSCTSLGPNDGSGEGKGYSIVMTRVPGQSLEKVWGDLDEETKRTVVSELMQYLDQLHALKGSFIGSIDGTPTCEPNLEERLRPKTTLPSVASFHDLIPSQIHQVIPSDLKQLAGRALNDKHGICFSHADIFPSKIMVQDGHISGIIDWESAGFYPQYWDFAKALFDADWQCGSMAEHICSIADAYRRDVAAYQTCTQFFYIF